MRQIFQRIFKSIVIIHIATQFSTTSTTTEIQKESTRSFFTRSLHVLSVPNRACYHQLPSIVPKSSANIICHHVTRHPTTTGPYPPTSIHLVGLAKFSLPLFSTPTMPHFLLPLPLSLSLSLALLTICLPLSLPQALPPSLSPSQLPE